MELMMESLGRKKKITISKISKFITKENKKRRRKKNLKNMEKEILINCYMSLINSLGCLPPIKDYPLFQTYVFRKLNHNIVVS